jgi:hypothetical protein
LVPVPQQAMASLPKLESAAICPFGTGPAQQAPKDGSQVRPLAQAELSVQLVRHAPAAQA